MPLLPSLAPYAAFALCLALGGSMGAQVTDKATQIDVVANDYAFLPLPQHVAAGRTVFAFANQGKVQHEMSIARLKSGVTVEEVVAAYRGGSKRRNFFDRSVGILIAGPGKSPEGKLLVDLLPGSTYFIFCNLKDTPDAPGHMMLGMYTVLHAE